MAVFAAALLVAYLALFPAAFAVALWPAPANHGRPRRACCRAAPVWVATELGRQYVWDGFPWVLLGYSQITVLPIAQLASVTGVYGLSGLLRADVGRACARSSLERGRAALDRRRDRGDRS